MAQIIKKKELVNTELSKNYGSWFYCGNCKENIGYLCYVTYSNVNFEYTCKCGNHGSLSIEKDKMETPMKTEDKLIIIRNRLCCPKDNSPLITILNQKLDSSSYSIVCESCNHEYSNQ